jgi:hypothetical protein
MQAAPKRNPKKPDAHAWGTNEFEGDLKELLQGICDTEGKAELGLRQRGQFDKESIFLVFEQP